MKLYLLKKDLERYYLSLTSQIDFNIPFIYFPLHYQPEATTSPRGGYYANQMYAISLLASLIPENWIVYVKEHPLIYAFWDNGDRSRDKQFYQEILEISNVKLIPHTTSALSLIDNSIAVATITGTSGYEAIIKGKPALIFGNIWYSGCPGVYDCSTVDFCRKAISDLKKGVIIDENLAMLYSSIIIDNGYNLPVEKNRLKINEDLIIKTEVEKLAADIIKYLKPISKKQTS